MLPLTLNLLSTATIEEGPLFESRFLNEDTGASDELYNAVTVDEIVESVRLGSHGYIIQAKDSRKYHRDLYNLIIDYRGFRYALGVQVVDSRVIVNSFINQGRLEHSMSLPHAFPQFYL